MQTRVYHTASRPFLSSFQNHYLKIYITLNKQVAYIDFQQFDQGARVNADIFFLQFVRLLGNELKLPAINERDWPMELSTVIRCTHYMKHVLLPTLDAPLLVAMDEVDSILGHSFSADFFGMLRAWHNSRALPKEPIWRRLDIALVTSTEPYELIQNLKQSPFNVGHVIDLVDFSAEEVGLLNKLHGLPLNKQEEVKLFELLGGHPYLTRLALYLVADNRFTVDDLFTHATKEEGPFGEHLRRHLQHLEERPELAREFRKILMTNGGTDNRAFWRLRGAGLVRLQDKQKLARCLLYSTYFKEALQ